MPNSQAVTKVQTITLIAITIIAVTSGAVAYYASLNQSLNPQKNPTPTMTAPSNSATPSLTSIPTTLSTSPLSTSIPTLTSTPQPKDPIRIGVCADLDASSGPQLLKGATLAVEQINDAGGLLGRNLTIVSEDDDGETGGDIAIAQNALTKLITVDKAEYVIAGGGLNAMTYEDKCCKELKKILFTIGTPMVDLTQRVVDDYATYKYYFRAGYLPNSTALNMAYVQNLVAMKNNTGFTKIGYLLMDIDTSREITIPYFDSQLPKLGFQIVYRALFPGNTVDFTSYFAQAEAAKTQILFVILPNIPKSVTLVDEWYERQSPLLLCGDIYGIPDTSFWNMTSGKAEFALSRTSAATLGYPVTSKTIPTRDAFQQRWGIPVKAGGACAYDIVKFILSEAIKRAGTTETEAVIKELEKTNTDTSNARGFQFTSSHDIYIDIDGMTNPTQSNIMFIEIQWQNGTQVPVFPESLRIDAGASYKYPLWPGPWSQK
jgi:branched-chain amino acid transport system substrate-binding protein